MSNISEQNCDVHLYAEIEILKQALADKQSELIAMETTCLRETDRQVELEDSIIAWQDKYDRLYESHKRVQKVNQSLEDKLLKLVDRNSGERAQLTSDVATLSVRLAQANYNIATLQREIERYKTDMSLAIQLLQCKPDSFVSQKVSSLPLEIQSKVAQYMRLDSASHSDSEGSTSGVGVATSSSYRVLPASDSPPPLCPFPPTAMVYSMRGIDDQSPNKSQMISPSVIAKYLEDELQSTEIKHCETCACINRDLTVLADTALTYNVGTQTILQGDQNNALCLRCNSNLNSPSRTNSPFILKLVKSSDSVISETKSSVSDSNDNDKLFTLVKKDDLMVNPILGHHRLCDRTSKILDTANKCTEMPRDSNNDLLHLKQQQQQQKISAMHSPEIANSSHSINSRHNLSDKKIDLSQCNAKRNDTEPSKKTETVGGSTNSLWSKTSSSNNTTEGSKLFENFNRNLIKSIKADNPKISGPRLCALRIQNGTSNILLDNIESSNLSPIIYTRRTRFLDEELDETKDVITSNGECSKSNISMVMSSKPNIGIGTVDGSNIAIDTSISNVSGVAVENHTIDDNLINKHQQQHVLETDTMSSKNANQSYTQSSSISSEINIQESALLRRQQLTRVAEWVQNNHMDGGISGNLMSSQSVCSSTDAASIDSGYKTKVNNCGNDLVVVLDSEQHNFKNKNDNIIVANINESTRIIVSSLNDDQNQKLGNEFAQNHLIHNSNIIINTSNNIINNNFSTTSTASLNGPKCMIDNFSKEQQFLNKSNEISNGNAQIDLAQMEYNVKQFLLKQNEWSIHNKSRFENNCSDTITATATTSGTSTTSVITTTTTNMHRTETNL